MNNCIITGGTHPALVEAMAFGNCVITHNTPENLETIGDAGFSYDGKVGADSLQQLLEKLLLSLYTKTTKITKNTKSFF
ncbi:hypothetical protein PN36_02695 [Candidatus Thiomargarita nelsonii]|uniref:Uncharacterized protein n=1 Tax=Candidatus Thiomargarita nelsonii TaxID=1003181 RepID=A0A0A6PE75_9GAMM|nr:hypothetical protein PN36_02695 [Candidatus Thiomargarita nelsonii]